MEMKLVMLHALLLIPALRTVFSSSIEFTSASFEFVQEPELDYGDASNDVTTEKVYRVANLFEIAMDSHVRAYLVRKLSYVTESEMSNLLNAVRFIYMSSKEIDDHNPTFADRLALLRKRFPENIIGR